MGFCDCDSECPESAACTCMYIVSEGLCVCVCTMETIQLPVMLKEDDAVNLSVRDSYLGAVAEFVHKVTDSEVMIPVSKLRDQISADLEDVSFAEAMREVGLELGPATTPGETARIH